MGRRAGAWLGLAALVALVLGSLGGLRRLGLATAPPEAGLVHGPVMVCGFLGTLIGLERALGARARWAWLAPIASALGAALALGGLRPVPAACAAGLGALALLAIYARAWRVMPLPVAAVNVGSALAYLGGAVGWGMGQPFARIAPLWGTFLVLTVAAERLELARYAPAPRWAPRALAGSLAVLAAGLVLGSVTGPGRLHGVGWMGLAASLAAIDPARRAFSVSQEARFAALAVLSAYGWLGLAGALVSGPGVWWAGGRYDGALHAVFVGFVMPMVLAHAPLVVGLLTGRSVPFSSLFYAPFAVLHLSLLARLGGDLLDDEALRRAGAVGNTLVLPMLLLLLLGSRLTGARRLREEGPVAPQAVARPHAST